MRRASAPRPASNVRSAESSLRASCSIISVAVVATNSRRPRTASVPSMMLTPAFHFDVLVAFVLPFYNDESPAADRTDGGRLILVMVQQVLRGGSFDRSERRLVFPRRAVLSGPMYGHDPRAKVRGFGQAEKIGAFRRVLCDFERGLRRPDRPDIDRWSVIETCRGAPEFDDFPMSEIQTRTFAEVIGR